MTGSLEILITKNSLTGSGRTSTRPSLSPKKDKRDEFFVAAEVNPANLGISSIFLPCKALCEYFYRIPETEGLAGKGFTMFFEFLVPPPPVSSA